jgi:hypothetical protein
VVRDFDLEAIGQCEVIYLPRPAFSAMMARHPDVARHFGKDDIHRREAMTDIGGNVMQAAQAFLSAGVELESLLVINLRATDNRRWADRTSPRRSRRMRRRRC